MKEQEIADPLQKYADQILKTGFDLEFRAGRSLQRKGWSVISNKYVSDRTFTPCPRGLHFDEVTAFH